MSFRERIQVNRGEIREVDVVRLVQRLRPAAVSLGPDAVPTFFEFVTVLALCWFREQECDLVVWETGMGGRLDATNIVTPLASIITECRSRSHGMARKLDRGDCRRKGGDHQTRRASGDRRHRPGRAPGHPGRSLNRGMPPSGCWRCRITKLRSRARRACRSPVSTRS